MNIKSNSSLFKKLTLILLPISIIIVIIAYQNISYNKFLHNFKNYFNNAEYSNANNTIINESKYNIFKKLSLNSDLKYFFNTKLDSINQALSSNSITKKDAKSIVEEISKYGLNEELIKEYFSKDIFYEAKTQELTKAIELYENNKFKECLDALGKIPTSSEDYEYSKKYIKLALLSYVDELAKDNYYTKGIETLKKSYSQFKDDTELLAKENELLAKRTNYLASINEEKQTSNASIVSSISTSNINTLNLSSYTSYLIFVSLADQKTYVYTGSKNNWQLAKTFLCSTGIQGKDTPTGVYNITTRGEWFYAPQFEQGGKYWLSFYGDDYLFHSLPFAEDKKTVVDWTVGQKASHGCIRLPIEDSKWLYDNIPSDTKVIIK